MRPLRARLGLLPEARLSRRPGPTSARHPKLPILRWCRQLPRRWLISLSAWARPRDVWSGRITRRAASAAAWCCKPSWSLTAVCKG